MTAAKSRKPAATASSASIGARKPSYLSGFGNEFATEALVGALPIGQNSPQTCPYGLYAEQLSGTAFTAPRGANRRSWLYRIRPAAVHKPFRRLDNGHLTNDFTAVATPPNPLRWDPLPIPTSATDFVEGIVSMAGNGDPHAQQGCGIHLYAANRSMSDRFFYNADAEMLIVAQLGAIRFCTEFGIIDISPGEIAVIPRGVKLRCELPAGPARAFICENYGGSFTLPERGPIGANCLANPRDFLTPVAAYEDRDAASVLVVKWGGALWQTALNHSPLDVVAWHGNYAPYKYDLRRFSPVGPVLFDHADPSIFTVLTAPSDTPGTANIDFVIFPDRWTVAENTFRPPWFHMNVMSEFMGLIYGAYDAKAQGFVPGGFSLHNSMLPHGPDRGAFEAASAAELKPHKLENTMAFMFETRFPQRVTAYAAGLPQLQASYGTYGTALVKRFDPSKP